MGSTGWWGHPPPPPQKAVKVPGGPVKGERVPPGPPPKPPDGGLGVPKRKAPFPLFPREKSGVPPGPRACRVPEVIDPFGRKRSLNRAPPGSTFIGRGAPNLPLKLSTREGVLGPPG